MKEVRLKRMKKKWDRVRGNEENIEAFKEVGLIEREMRR